MMAKNVLRRLLLTFIVLAFLGSFWIGLPVFKTHDNGMANMQVVAGQAADDYVQHMNDESGSYSDFGYTTVSATANSVAAKPTRILETGRQKIKTIIDKLAPKENLDKTQKFTEKVYLGGMPLGISLVGEGLIVTAKNDIVTQNGVVNPTLNSSIKKGDILLYINDTKTTHPKDIVEALRDNRGEAVVLRLRRNEIEFEERVYPACDYMTGTSRLGLVVKAELLGIGTLTYVTPSGRFGALGHQIADAETGAAHLNSGYLHDSTIIGLIRGERNRPGELRGAIDKMTRIATIDKNNQFGIFGQVGEGLTSKLEKIEIGGKYTVRPGRAHIRTTINEGAPELYEIEIVKTNFQGFKGQKGMLIRVVDSRLLDTSGGIVQGMSGSPIIQDGKLVGAVTHVFSNDPTKGYGIYIDNMIFE